LIPLWGINTKIKEIKRTRTTYQNLIYSIQGKHS
jgi:hypothetical protein